MSRAANSFGQVLFAVGASATALGAVAAASAFLAPVPAGPLHGEGHVYSVFLGVPLFGVSIAVALCGRWLKRRFPAVAGA